MIRKLSRPRLLGGDRDDANDGRWSPIQRCQFARHSAHPAKQRRSTRLRRRRRLRRQLLGLCGAVHGENRKHGFRVVVCSCFLRPCFEERTKLIAWRSRHTLPGFGTVYDKKSTERTTDRNILLVDGNIFCDRHGPYL
jgi:hypothetical protein